MERRSFINISTLGGISLMLPYYSCMGENKHSNMDLNDMSAFQQKSFKLLKTWCDALLRDQVDDVSKPTIHGALYCNACQVVHGRCNEAIYPLMFLADATGDKKYLDAAIKLWDWSANVDGPEGSWLNMMEPDAWKGITVFGAIAIGEALHFHGHLLTAKMKTAWETRLKAATEYVYKTFHFKYSNINYRATAVYGLYFLGNYFKEEKYLKRSREFLEHFKEFLTEPNALIFGEDKPNRKKTAKGFYPIDLGYNVEETLNNVVQYAVLAKDEALLQILTKSMNSHLEFMLPDGAWDNSWGTRHNKWTYWGSRTADGCQPGFSLMADRNPAFGTAAILSTELLERCTVDGLLAGGLHYQSHGVKPCIHHTFSHSKSLAFLLNHKAQLSQVNKATPIPRAISDGIRHFSELDVWLGARGAWKCTVSAYDQIWKVPTSVPGQGGALNVLWHSKIGPIFTASMAEYVQVEPYNQQDQPGIDFCLTPRIERYVDGVWYTNIYDLQAKVEAIDEEGTLKFKSEVNLAKSDRTYLNDESQFTLEYRVDIDKAVISAKRTTTKTNGDTLVLPMISSTGEKVIQTSKYRIEIHKPKGTVCLESNVPISIKETESGRIFNQVPGMEALPFLLKFASSDDYIKCTITIM